MRNDPEVILQRIDYHLRAQRREALDNNDFRTVHAIAAAIRTVQELLREVKSETRNAA